MIGSRARTALLLFVGIGLFWLSLASATSMVLGSKIPAAAMRLGLPSAQTKAASAFFIMANRPSADQIDRARQLAQAALTREPVNVTAVVTLGTIAALHNRADLGRRLFTYSERLSRHDSITQLWMVEDRVSHGDVAGALIHYDRTMRVTPALRPTLVPILVQASRDPAIAHSLANILARRPNWWADALVPLIFQSATPVATLPIILAPLHLRTDNEQERAYLAAALTRLVGAGAFNQAYALFLDAGRIRLTGSNLVRDGSFEGDSRLPPFDWDFHNEDGRAAVVQFHQGARPGKALFLYTDPDHQGELARQMLLLGPGRYRVSGQAGNVAGDQFARPQVTIICAAHDPAPVLADLRLPVSNDAGQVFHSDFVVPAGCPAQWLVLAGHSGSPTQNDAPWIDEIGIHSLG